MVAAVVAAGLLAFAGCGSGGSGRAAGGSAELDVVATTAVVADFVRNVGGDRVHVVQILKPGVDPHDYEASPADIQAIADADLVVKSGVGLEATWLDDTVSSAGYGGEVVDASRGVTIRARRRRPTSRRPATRTSGTTRPNARIMVGDIAAALVARDPAGKAGYERNAAAYDAKLAALDAENEAEIGTIPVEQRKLVTNHDAFGYYCRALRHHVRRLDHPELRHLGRAVRQGAVRPGREDRGRPACGRCSPSPRCRRRPPRRSAAEAGVQVVEGEDALYARRSRPGRLARRRPTSGPSGTTPTTIVKALGGRV